MTKRFHFYSNSRSAKKKAMAAAWIMTAVVSSISALPAFASNYPPVPGTETELEKVLITDKKAEIPAEEFTFSVRSGSAAAETDSTVKVWAGLNPERVKVNGQAGSGTVAFAAGEAKTAGEEGDTFANSSEKVYAVKTIALDFSEVSFPEPGVYRYLIAETAPAAPVISVDDPVTTVDVYVHDTAGVLEIAGYVAYEGEITAAPKTTEGEETITPLDGKTPNGAEAGEKDDKFRNELPTQNLEFGKEVTGNQGSKDQYFSFRLSLTGLGAGTVLNVETDSDVLNPHRNDATAYSVEDMKAANNRDDDSNKDGHQLTADENGEVSWDLYLHDGQYVTVLGIPKGAQYSLTETDEAAGYRKTETISDEEGKDGTAYRDSVSGTVGNADILTGYTNDRTGVIPTGIAAASGGGLLILAAGAAGLAAGRKRKAAK